MLASTLSVTEEILEVSYNTTATDCVMSWMVYTRVNQHSVTLFIHDFFLLN